MAHLQFCYRRGSYSSAGIVIAEMSVRPSVTFGMVASRFLHLRTHHGEPDDSSFCGYQLHPSSSQTQNSKGVTPSEGVTEWDRYELAIFDLYVTISPKRCKIGLRLLMITNRKSHGGIRAKLSIGTKINDHGWLTLN